MAVDTRQAAGTVRTLRADVLVDVADDASHLQVWRTLALLALAVTLVLSVTAVSLRWEGLATYDVRTPGAPLNAADAEQ